MGSCTTSYNFTRRLGVLHNTLQFYTSSCNFTRCLVCLGFLLQTACHTILCY